MTNDEILDFVRDRCIEDGGCWIWQGCVQHCGTTPTVRIPGTRRTTGTRRLVLQACGVNTAGKLATNTCESPLCVAPDHLAAVSRKQLQRKTSDNLPLGTRIKRAHDIAAVTRANAKLTPQIVELIKRSPLPTRQIARYLGVCQHTVWAAVTGRHWNEVPYSSPFAGLLLS